MKKVLLFGADGMLGGELAEYLNKKYDIHTTTLKDLNICNKEAIIQKVKDIKPYFIINCAAYTNVDECEIHYDLANKINGEALKSIVEATKIVNATIIHISTDYVFDGNLNLDKTYTEDMKPNPINAYGRTKLLGEQNVQKYDKYYILRTSWLYGIRGKNFVKTMLKLSKEKEEIKVVNDQHGSPTSVMTLCRIIEQVMEKEPEYGIYHATCEGFTTWYEFTKKIFEEVGITTKVEPITSSEYKKIYPASSNRPTNSMLSKEKLHRVGIYPLDYENALKEYLKEERKQ